MRWILSNSKDIVVNGEQIQARKVFIQKVTGVEVSDWRYMVVEGKICKDYLCCVSDDGLDGTFITAHIQDVNKLCMLHQICFGEFVVANTCIWKRMSHKNLLHVMRRSNQNVELWFAKQELSLDAEKLFRQSTTLLNVGQFGFQTSMSERELFRHRREGIMEAIQKSFVHVSPVIFLGD